MGRRRGFSWKRALGISAAKGRISRKIGIPLTRSGRRKKLKRMGCSTMIGILVLATLVLFGLL